jgi:hypothetical protein
MDEGLGFEGTAKMQLTCQDSLGEHDDKRNKRTERGVECRQGSGGMPYGGQGM